MKIARFVGVCLLPILLWGCQPPTFSIYGAFRGVDLYLFPKDDGMWPLGWGLDRVDSDLLQVRTRGALLWVIRRREGDCTGVGEHHPFPLRYGELPKCFEELLAAKTLPAGEWINVDSTGFRQGNGYIRLLTTVQSRGWRDLGTAHDWPDGSYLEPRDPEWLASEYGQHWLRSDEGRRYARHHRIDQVSTKAAEAPTAAATNATQP